MPAKKIDFDAVKRIGLALPGVEEGTAYGSAALKVRGKMLACMASHRSAERGSLIVCVGFEARDELTAAEPNAYYITPHYVSYPVVLVRLHRIDQDVLKHLLQMASRFVSASGSKTGRRRPARRERS